MNNCFICKSKFNKQYGNHVYHCAKKNGIEGTKPELKLTNIQYNSTKDIIFEKLYEMYVTLEYSVLELSEYYNISSTDSIFLLDFFGINKRSIKEANATNRRSATIKETCLQKYGVDNPSKSIEIQQKKEETFLKNYGVTNIFSVDGIRDKFHNTMLERYGTGSISNKNGYNHANWWNSIDSDDKAARILKMNLGWTKFWNNLSTTEKDEIILQRKDTYIKNGNHVPFLSTSGLETRVNGVLQINGISFVWQKWITQKSYDFHILNTNCILEINGDYWHANPKIYDENELISYPGIKKYAKDVWAADKYKKELAESYGYKVYYIWEHDMNKLDEGQLTQLILGIINENQKY